MGHIRRKNIRKARKSAEHRNDPEGLYGETAGNIRTTFLNNMSHELKTPLHAVLGFTDLALAHLDDREQLEIYLKKIQSSGNHLLSLINNMFDMSRMEEGALQMEEESCSVPELIAEVQEMLQEAADWKQIDFQSNASDIHEASVVCDRRRLRQILVNLTENAIKFTNTGGCVSVRASQLIGSRREGYGIYEFSIKDSGIGMNREFQSHLFEPFNRERTSTEGGGAGMGLGLAITKRIVDAMQGTIQVFSEEGQGTAVVVRLELAVESDRDNEKPSGSKSVLVVEDNELNREIAAEMLQEHGFSVQTAENGAAAVDLISQSEPGDIDVILMDVQMPVMDGYEAARAIRSMENRDLADIRIIAMTADDFGDAVRKSAAAGMNGYVAKPVDVDRLLAAIG